MKSPTYEHDGRHYKVCRNGRLVLKCDACPALHYREPVARFQLGVTRKTCALCGGPVAPVEVCGPAPHGRSGWPDMAHVFQELYGIPWEPTPPRPTCEAQANLWRARPEKAPPGYYDMAGNWVGELPEGTTPRPSERHYVARIEGSVAYFLSGPYSSRGQAGAAMPRVRNRALMKRGESHLTTGRYTIIAAGEVRPTTMLGREAVGA